MRAVQTVNAILVAAVLMLSGCKSGLSSSGWSWNRKHDTAGASSTAQNAPQLPSASALPSGTAPTGGNPADPNGYAAAGQNAPGGYPGQPTGYNNPATAPNYQPPQMAAQPGAPTAPQSGPYNEGYGQVQASPQQFSATPSNTPQYQPTAPAQSPPAQAADPYAATPQGSYAQAGTSAAPISYGGGGVTGASGDPNAYRTADSRSADQPPTDPYAAGQAPPQSEQAAADRYAATNTAADQAAGGAPYQPGNTGYTPGQTGYTPPGTAPYQSPAAGGAADYSRRDPYYRPGGTSDYLPSNAPPPGAAAAPPATDRYGQPTGAADPYGAPANYAPPAAGNYPPAAGNYPPQGASGYPASTPNGY